jgi:hypothetical protein
MDFDETALVRKGRYFAVYQIFPLGWGGCAIERQILILKSAGSEVLVIHE